MRRIAWFLVACGAALITLAPAALGDVSGTYADRFDQVSYSGSNGNMAWSGPWVEVGETNGPGVGAVRVESDTGCNSGRCLKITGALLELNQAGAARFADTSVFSTAELTFAIASETPGSGGLDGALTGASFTVEVTTDSGSVWTVIYRGDLLEFLDGGASKVLSLDSFLSPGFGVRFLAQDLFGGEVMVDDVEVSGLLEPAPTTTVTTTTVAPRPSITGPEPVAHPTTTTTTTTRVDEVGPSRDTTTTTLRSDSPAPGPPVDPEGGSPSGEQGGGLRISESGVQADAGGLSLRPVDLAGGHRSAVERIASDWLSLAGLAMIVTGASVFGVDKRRSSRELPDE